MPVITFSAEEATLTGRELREVTKAFGVELYCTSMPLSEPRVQVRSRLEHVGLGYVRIAELSALKSRLLSWGLRPLSEEGQQSLQDKMDSAPRDLYVEYANVVVEAPGPLAGILEGTGVSSGVDKDGTFNADGSFTEDAPPWQPMPDVSWFAEVVSDEVGALASDGIILSSDGLEVLDLTVVERMRWDPTRSEVLFWDCIDGLNPPLVASMDVRQARKVLRAWLRILVRRARSTPA